MDAGNTSVVANYIYIYTHTHIHMYKMIVMGWVKFEERISGGHPTWKIGRYVPSTWHRDDDLQIKISGQTVCPRFLFSRDDRWRLHFESRIRYSESLSGWETNGGPRSNRNPFREVFEKKRFFFFQIFRSDSKGKSIFYIQSGNDETRSGIDGDRQISPSSFFSS